MEYNKPVMWNGKSDLVGHWRLTYKIDGIRVFLNDKNEVVSRNGKPLYNMDHLKEKIRKSMPEGCEVFLGTFKATVEAVRTKNSYKPVPESALFALHPIDKRLFLGDVASPSKGALWQAFKLAKKEGFEGLIVRNHHTGQWLKIKKYETVDVKVIGFYEGKGKHKGRLGGFITYKGRVGTGISDLQRKLWWPKGGAWSATCEFRKHPLYSTTIECKCMEITPAGKMRKPRFIRLRPDK